MHQGLQFFHPQNCNLFENLLSYQQTIKQHENTTMYFFVFNQQGAGNG